MDIKIVYSRRKTLSLRVCDDGGVKVCAPSGVPEREVRAFVSRHTAWIEKRQAALEKRRLILNSVDDGVIARWRAEAEAYIPQRVAYYAAVMGVTPTGVKITSAKTRFGSCSGKNALCFSLYLMYYPKEAVDAVVVHELAHIRRKDHSPAFYAEVERVMPDYKARKGLLKNGIL